MTHARILLIGFLLLLAPYLMHAQSGSSASGINLQLVQMDSAVVQLSWQSPQTATACMLRYETQFGFTDIPISNFTQNGITISRINPHGSWESFTLTFNIGGANGLITDRIVVRGTYGGVVLIDDDIFCIPVFEGCGDPAAEEFHFQAFALLATKDVVCSLTDMYRAEHGLWMPEYAEVVDSVTFSGWLHIKLVETKDDGGDVWECDYIDPDVGGGYIRKANLSVEESKIVCSPNPFGDRLHITPSGELGNTPTEIIVQDLFGKTVARQRVNFSTHSQGINIDTRTWRKGIYIVQAGKTGSFEPFKVVKR